MDGVAWTTLAFSAISALGVIVNSYFAFARHRRETRDAMSRDAMSREGARWSLEMIESGDEAAEQAGWRRFKITRLATDAPRVALMDIAVSSPRGARIADADPARAGTRLAFNREMKNDVAIRLNPPGFEDLPHGSKLFLARLPPASWFRRSARLEIRLHAEEISSARRSIHLIMKSQPIVLTARRPERTA